MFLAWKKSENESKNGSKITKKRFRATPHQRVEKNTLQTQKMNPKSWKTRGFFTFFWPGLAGEATNKSIPYCFLQCFVKASVTTYQKQEVFSKKCPPQVNLNLSWLMPSGWSRPLHLRCGRISLSHSKKSHLTLVASLLANLVSFQWSNLLYHLASSSAWPLRSHQTV